jgi:hypothetical protein
MPVGPHRLGVDGDCDPPTTSYQVDGYQLADIQWSPAGCNEGTLSVHLTRSKPPSSSDGKTTTYTGDANVIEGYGKDSNGTWQLLDRNGLRTESDATTGPGADDVASEGRTFSVSIAGEDAMSHSHSLYSTERSDGRVQVKDESWLEYLSGGTPNNKWGRARLETTYQDARSKAVQFSSDLWGGPTDPVAVVQSSDTIYYRATGKPSDSHSYYRNETYSYQGDEYRGSSRVIDRSDTTYSPSDVIIFLKTAHEEISDTKQSDGTFSDEYADRTWIRNFPDDPSTWGFSKEVVTAVRKHNDKTAYNWTRTTTYDDIIPRSWQLTGINDAGLTAYDMHLAWDDNGKLTTHEIDTYPNPPTSDLIKQYNAAHDSEAAWAQRWPDDRAYPFRPYVEKQ